MAAKQVAVLIGAFGLSQAGTAVFRDCGVHGNSLADATKCNQGLCFQEPRSLEDDGILHYGGCDLPHDVTTDDYQIDNISWERYKLDANGEEETSSALAQNPIFSSNAWTSSDSNGHSDGRKQTTIGGNNHPYIATCTGPLEVTNGKFGVEIAFFDIKNMFCSKEGNMWMRHPIDTKISQDSDTFASTQWSDLKGGTIFVPTAKDTSDSPWDSDDMWKENVVDTDVAGEFTGVRAKEFARYLYFAKKVCQGRRVYRTLNEDLDEGRKDARTEDNQEYTDYDWFCGCNEMEGTNHPDGDDSEILASCNPAGGSQWMCREQESRFNHDTELDEIKWSCVDNPYSS